MTELYTACSLHALPAEEIIAILACFIGERCAVSDWSGVTPSIVEGVQNIERMIETYKLLESKIGYPLDNYWAIYTEMVEPMYRWICGDDMSAICATYEIFEGNMMRSIMKMVHIVDEWIAMATYCMHVEQIDKMMGMRSKLIRDVIVSESLYLSL
jgi:superfamily II RNA helicase